MKIAEIVGSYADWEEPEIAPDNSLLQTVANALTRSGKVKRPLNQQPSGDLPSADFIPFSSLPVSDDDSVADAVSKDSSYARRVLTYSCGSP
jgi:hypothetical protein